jgi:hypothetical protein
MGADRNQIKWEELEKVSKSKARVVKQYGGPGPGFSGEPRIQEGGIYALSAQTPVWLISDGKEASMSPADEFERALQASSVIQASSADTFEAALVEKSATAAEGFNLNRVEILVENTNQAVHEMKHSLNLYRRDPGKYAPQLENIKLSATQVATAMRVLLRTLD